MSSPKGLLVVLERRTSTSVPDGTLPSHHQWRPHPHFLPSSWRRNFNVVCRPIGQIWPNLLIDP